VPPRATNGKLLQIDELLLVRGWSDLTREQWARFRPLLTARHARSAHQRQHAPELLLVGLFDQVDAAAAAKAIAARAERERVNGGRPRSGAWLVARSRSRCAAFSTCAASRHGTRHRIAAGVRRGVAITENRNGARPRRS